MKRDTTGGSGGGGGSGGTHNKATLRKKNCPATVDGDSPQVSLCSRDVVGLSTLGLADVPVLALVIELLHASLVQTKTITGCSTPCRRTSEVPRSPGSSA